MTIPHDPRIDLIPTPHMRDRMILFRDQFDLDDCFRCLLGHSVFHGGDPAIAANWQLPPEFFEKYWFLTIDYDLRRTTNRWRRLQGLSELDFKQQQKQQQQELKRAEESENPPQPLLEQQSHHQQLNHADLSSLLGIDFWKITQQNAMNSNTQASYASSLSSDCSYNTTSSPLQAPTSPTAAVVDNDPVSSFEPVRLTNGYSFSYSKPQAQTQNQPQAQPTRKPSLNQHKTHRHHPYQQPATTKTQTTPTVVVSSETCDPWDTLLADSTVTNQNYGNYLIDKIAKQKRSDSDSFNLDLIMDDLIDTEQTC